MNSSVETVTPLLWTSPARLGEEEMMLARAAWGQRVSRMGLLGPGVLGPGFLFWFLIIFLKLEF